MKLEKLQHKQKCADRLQSILGAQANCLRQIQYCGYMPTPALKEEASRLFDEHKAAREAYEKADLECDTPVYVTPIV